MIHGMIKTSPEDTDKFRDQADLGPRGPEAPAGQLEGALVRVCSDEETRSAFLYRDRPVAEAGTAFGYEGDRGRRSKLAL
jgi:hypothetical protein